MVQDGCSSPHHHVCIPASGKKNWGGELCSPNDILKWGKWAGFIKGLLTRVSRTRRKVTSYLGLSTGGVVTTSRLEGTGRGKSRYLNVQRAVAVMKGLAFGEGIHHANLQPGIDREEFFFFSNDFKSNYFECKSLIGYILGTKRTANMSSMHLIPNFLPFHPSESPLGVSLAEPKWKSEIKGAHWCIL